MSYPLTPEQAALLEVARTAWQRRRQAKMHRLSFGEESITETILMDLAESFPARRLTILPFSKPEEGRNGADWAWLFRDDTGTVNLPMLVQAKVLDLRDVEYPEIKRTIGKKPSPPRQIDRLIDTAEAWGWPAVYAFYNHLDDTSRIPDICRSLPARDEYGPIPESWGVSIADAYAVRNALDDQTFDTHRNHSRPLHCLLCSGGRGVRPGGGSPELAYRALRGLRREADLSPAIESSWDGPAGRPRIRVFDEPPELFGVALDIQREESDERRASRIEGLARENPSIAGVVVLQDDKTRRPPHT